MSHLTRGALVLLALGVLTSGAAAKDEAPKRKLQKGDRVVFVGNTFAERMIEFGYLETMLQARWPDLSLTFRNLAWSGDRVDKQPRPLNFGDMHTHLKEQKADVIVMCFGMNESFDGKDGLP